MQKSFWKYFFVLLAINSSAQLDSNYVKYYPEKLVISYFISGRAYENTISESYHSAGTASTMHYVAQGNTSWGFGIDWDKISFSYGFKIPSTDVDVYRKGLSFTKNIALSLNAKKWRIEGSFRNYSGFYDAQTPYFIPNFTDSMPYYQDADLRTKEFRIKGIYFRNKKKRFSYASAYANTQRQLKTAGSFIWEGNLYRETVSSPNGIINPYIPDSMYHDYHDLTKLKLFGLTMGPGYSLNIIFLKKMFLNLTLSYGFGLQIRQSITSDGIPDKTDAKINWNVADGRLSAGFNGDHLFIYLNATGDWTTYDIDKISLTKKLGYFGVKMGYRFNFKENTVTKAIKNSRIYQLI